MTKIHVPPKVYTLVVCRIYEDDDIWQMLSPTGAILKFESKSAVYRYVSGINTKARRQGKVYQPYFAPDYRKELIWTSIILILAYTLLAGLIYA